VQAIFAPEHGAAGVKDSTKVGDSTDEATGVPIYSVYGDTAAKKHPTAEMLKGLDALIVDLPDIGARFWTYDTAMGYFLEAAASSGLEIYVLDHPNPIGGVLAQGPVFDQKESYVSYHRVPTRHGMTIGELAQMFNAERKINAKLTVIALKGWMRGDWLDATNLPWVNPSPNIRDLLEETLYPGVALVEGTNVSVGRGTDTPFEVVGAPWVKGRELAEYLNGRNISGVRFVPTAFTPDNRFENSKLVGQKCGGVNIVVMDRYALDTPELGVEIASALIKLYPKDFKPDRMIELLGNQAAFQALVAGNDPRRIADEWRDGLQDFMQIRAKYLIYK
jgi:uncharacterized protein YbbC (DUF1343 family)